MRSALLLSALLLVANGCERVATASPQQATTKATAAVGAARIAKVVFIDKENACDCTKQKIDASWAALQTALGTPAALPVERIHLDTEAARAQVYTALKPLMVPPGVYLVDAREAVVELLQGELTQEQLVAALKQ